MTPDEMLDWLQENAAAFRETPADRRPFELEYINHSGETLSVRGANLRDCIAGAVSGDDVTTR